MTNSFSNVGSIVCGWVPFSAEEPAGVFAKGFQTNQWRQDGEGAANPTFHRFAKFLVHWESLGYVMIDVEPQLQAKNLRKVESDGFWVRSETTTSVTADAAKMRVTGIMPAMRSSSDAPGGFLAMMSR
jgi:hypothetical protein